MKHLNLNDALYQYMLDISLREDPILLALRNETAVMPLAEMQVAPEQAQFMQFLLRLIQGKRVLELGTYTGYSALAMALALPDDGELNTCDINVETTAIAQTFWAEAKQEHKIHLRLGPARNTLENLLEQGQAASFDLIFIDADKTNYVDYYEMALQLVRPSGLILIDNVFWGGQVLDTEDIGAQTREIQRLNALLQHDERVDISLLPIADGLMLVRPRK